MNTAAKLTQKNILVVDDDEDFRWAITNVLTQANYKVIQASDGDMALGCLQTERTDLVLLDQKMPGKGGMDVAEALNKLNPSLPIIMITAYSEIKTAVKAIKLGVLDYLTKPINNNDLLFVIESALKHAPFESMGEDSCPCGAADSPLFKEMGRSPVISRLAWKVGKVAQSDLTVLVEGESGVGKELVARAIHALSPFNKGPFIAVNCGAIPEALIESELFGYMKGAFTGAQENKPGFFELAQNGTLFLDEVGCLPYTAQQKLLRVIQDRRVLRLGARKSQDVNIRIIAATNQSLATDQENEKFRSDLYYRLKEFYIRVPTLYERKEDIPFLAQKFLKENRNRLTHQTVTAISDDAMATLVAHDWPGNVRELKNVIRQALLVCEKSVVGAECLDLDTQKKETPATSLPAFDLGDQSLTQAVRQASRLWESEVIRSTLEKTQGNKREAARLLKIDYKTLYRKLNSDP